MVLMKNSPRDVSRGERRKRQNQTWQSDWNVRVDRNQGRGASFKKFAKVEPVRELSWQEKLRADSEQAMEVLHGKLGKADIFAETDPFEAQRKIDEEHRTYAMGMMKAALKPIKERPTDKSRTNAVMKSVGLGVGMWLVSPAFRKGVRDLPKDTLTTMNEHVRSRVQAKVESKTAQGKRVGKFLQMRYDRAMQAEQGGYPPYSEFSAAVTVVGINDAYYEKIREPGVDKDIVTKRYQESIQKLYETAARDGVDPIQIDANMRYLVGQRMNKDPNYASRHAHTGYGDLKRTEPTIIEREDENGNTVKVERWDGQFKHTSGAVVTTSDPGYFVPRMPADAQEHTTHMRDEIGRDLGSATTADELHRKLFAWTAAQHDSFEDFAENNAKDGEPYEKGVSSSLDRMIMMMMDDGIDPGEAHSSYTTAFTHAFSELGSKNPELTRAWVKEYGEDWDLRLGAMLNDMENGELYVVEALSSGTQRSSTFAQDREQGRAGLSEEEKVQTTKNEQVKDDPFAHLGSSGPSGPEMDDDMGYEFDDDAESMFGGDESPLSSGDDAKKSQPTMGDAWSEQARSEQAQQAQDERSESVVESASSRASEKSQVIASQGADGTWQTRVQRRAEQQRVARQQAEVQREAVVEQQFDVDGDGSLDADERREADKSDGKGGTKPVKRAAPPVRAAQRSFTQQAEQSAARVSAENKGQHAEKFGARTTGVEGLGRVEVDLTPAQKAAAVRRAAATAKARQSTQRSSQKSAKAQRVSVTQRIENKLDALREQANEEIEKVTSKDSGPSL